MKKKKIAYIVFGKHDIGKTLTIKEVSVVLKRKPKVNVINYSLRPNGHDIQVIIEVDKIKIGIESQGDPNTELKERLNELAQKDCDIIICAARSYGKTHEDVKSACNQYTLVMLQQQEIRSPINTDGLRASANQNLVNLLLQNINLNFGI